MTSLGDWVERTLGDVGAPLGSPGDQVRDLVAKAGGNLSQVARDTGIPRRSLRDMVANLAAGKTVRPKATNAGRLETGVRAARMRDVPPTSAVVLHTEDRDRGAQRTISARQLKLADGTMQRVAEVYARTGDKEQAGAEFLRGVKDGWYRNYLRPREAAPEPPPRRGGGGGSGGGGGGGGGDYGDDGGYDDADVFNPDLDPDAGEDDGSGEEYEDPYDDLQYEDYYGEYDDDYGGTVG